jgi:hypothetical protein
MGEKGFKTSPEHRKALSEARRESWRTKTPEEMDAFREKQRDAATIRSWLPPSENRHKFPVGNSSYMTQEGLEKAAFTRAAKASIKRVMKELAEEDPELIKASLILGLCAEPPKSFPYLMLCASYLDGKPVEGTADTGSVDLSTLSNEELVVCAQRLISHVSGAPRPEPRVADLPVIDVKPAE